MRKLTTKDVQRARELREKRHTFEDIAARHGVTADAVRKRLSRARLAMCEVEDWNGVNVDPQRVSILAAYDLGRSVVSIARGWELQPAEVAAILQANGIEPSRWDDSVGAGREAEDALAARHGAATESGQ